MTTTIKVSCPTCRGVDLAPDQIQLVICFAAPLSFYSFVCPSCSDTVRKPADEHVVALLCSAPVAVRKVTRPAELDERHSGAPISEDDLIAFGLLSIEALNSGAADSDPSIRRAGTSTSGGGHMRGVFWK